MDNLLNTTNNISDAETILESIFSPTSDKSNMFTAAPITIDGCRNITGEVAKLISSYTPVNFFEEIPLCLIAAWVFALKYRKTNPEFLDWLETAMDVVPQHHIRFYISIISSALVEYDIDNFGINPNTPGGVERILKRHAEMVG